MVGFKYFNSMNKAEEEANRFIELHIDVIPCSNVMYKIATKHALITVNKKIDLLAEINNNESFNVSKYGNYYQEVKQILEDKLK